MMKETKLIFIFSVLLVFNVGLAYALYPTYVDITMVETRHENTSFSKDFFPIEITEYCAINGMINISNPSSETIGGIAINFSNTDLMVTNFINSAGRNGYQVGSFVPGEEWSVLVPELRAGDYAVFEYNLSCSTSPNAFNLSTEYSTTVGGIDRKVLAGKYFNVTKTVSNVFTSADIEDVIIYMDIQGVNWNGTVFNFSFGNYTTGDIAHVTQNSNMSWEWEPNGGTVGPGDEFSFNFYVLAPESVPTSGTYLFLEEKSRYSMSILLSNLTITSIRAVGDLDIYEQKQIVAPASNDNDTLVVWKVNANLSIPLNISYNISQVSIWVTHNISPIAYDTPFGRINTTYHPTTTHNMTNPWHSFSEPWYFNYTDGSDSATSPPPIVWIRPYYHLFTGGNQIVITNITQNGTDIYLSYIYVINGYWLQVQKNITNVAQDRYRVKIYVENIGNAWTPQDLAVTVYDFVPAEFLHPHDWEPAANSWDSSANVSGAGFNGTSYRFVIPNKAPFNASLGPEPPYNYWNVTYYVNGSGEYKVSELYIVGLDPRQVDGAGTHEGITVTTTLGSYTKEVFYAAGVIALIVLNIVNFVMTRRINNKLSRK